MLWTSQSIFQLRFGSQNYKSTPPSPNDWPKILRPVPIERHPNKSEQKIDVTEKIHIFLLSIAPFGCVCVSHTLRLHMCAEEKLHFPIVYTRSVCAKENSVFFLHTLLVHFCSLHFLLCCCRLCVHSRDCGWDRKKKIFFHRKVPKKDVDGKISKFSFSWKKFFFLSLGLLWQNFNQNSLNESEENQIEG